MKKKIISGLSLLILISTMGLSYSSTIKINQKDKETFYTMFFEKIDTDMFVNNEKGITINGNQIGQFKSGTTGITIYLSFYYIFKKFSKIEDFYEDNAIAKFAGVEAYQKNNNNNAFKYYNPELINWGINNLYISPDTKIYDIKAQDIYNSSFQRYFRLTTEAYIYLNKKKGLYKEEQKKYINEYNKTLKDEMYNFFGPEYLDLRYNKIGSFKQYNQEDFRYTTGTAIGFWLRRGLDKTDKIVWKGLKKIMINYDKEWFKKVSR